MFSHGAFVRALPPLLPLSIQEYAASVGTDAGGIPSELLQAASEIPADRSSVVLEGPANCTDADARASDGAGDADVDDVEVQCAAALDGGLDSCGPLQIWDNVMKRYKVKQICEQELQRLDAISNKSEIDRVNQKLAEATAEAVEGISKLRHREVFKQLEEFKASQADSKEVLLVEHGEEFLRTSDPAFWCMCFMRLFPRGDCMERCVERGSRLSSQRWIKSLLSRADFTLWRKDVEFVATAFNIFLRREQMQAVEAFCRSPLFTRGQAVELEKLTATGLVSHALASGDGNSSKEEEFGGAHRQSFANHANPAEECEGIRGGTRWNSRSLLGFALVVGILVPVLHAQPPRYSKPFNAASPSGRPEVGTPIFVGLH